MFMMAKMAFLNGGRPDIRFVGSAATQNTVTNASLVISKPTGVVTVDLLIAIMGNTLGSSATWTGSAGWTENIDQNAQPNLAAYAFNAGASEPSSYTFTGASSGSTKLSGCILAFRNAAYDTIGTIDTSTSMIAPAITLSKPDSTLLAIYMSSLTGVTWPTPPAGMTSLISHSDASNGPSYAIFVQDKMAAGSTGTRTSAPSSTSGSKAALLIGLKPTA